MGGRLEMYQSTWLEVGGKGEGKGGLSSILQPCLYNQIQERSRWAWIKALGDPVCTTEQATPHLPISAC